MDNKQQTAVELFAEQIRNYKTPLNMAGVEFILIHKEMINKFEQQAKEMESRQSHRYATFCLRCANENLPIIRFKDWIDLEGGEQ